MRIKKFFVLTIGILGMLCGCARVDILNATIPTSGYRVVKDIAYGEDDRHKLDIYIPDHLADKHPVVVFFYGGSWQEGSKDDYLFAGQAFASRGFVTVIADYRLYPQVYFPDFMTDAARAVVWTHNHIADYGGDNRHLFVAGHSAGGYNALMLALNQHYLRQSGGNPAWLCGAIGIAGPYDFLPMLDPNIIALFSKRPPPETQPITFVRPHAPPILLLTGDKDQDVLPRNSLNLAAALRRMNDDVTLITYPGIAHVGIALALADGFRDSAPVLDDISRFITHTTKGL